MSRIDVGCSFCGKTKGKVTRLIAGPGVFICDQCVELCNEILNGPPPVVKAGESDARASVRRSPRERWWRRWFRIEVPSPA